MSSKFPVPAKPQLLEFPYWVVWEEFNSTWQPSQVSDDEVAELEHRMTTQASIGYGHLTLGRAEIITMLSKLELEGDADAELVRDLFVISAHYLVPMQKRELGGGCEATRRTLAKIAKFAVPLSDAFDELGPDGWAVCQWVRANSIHDFMRSFSDPMRAATEVRDLGIAAAEIVRATKRRRGAPAKEHFDRCVHHLSDALQKATGNKIRTAGSKEHARFEGPEGTLVRNLFHRIHPELQEHLIVRSLKRVQREARERR